ncbi:MAG TPA: BON domain-containing protein [Dehalococcoidia bacterium]|jgi:osmotically-inducible protein OsmY|nr:BON domain-containing protein [Dehalococcoidia bacterium]
MADRIAPVRLGSRVCFDDRWQGRVSSLEVDEGWRVLNIGVTAGFLFSAASVRLPFSSVTTWSDDSVRIAVNSFQAFGRQVPPVAAPARPLDAGTPVAQPGTKFAGLVVHQTDRHALEVLLSRGVAGHFRVPVKDISFAGKTMTIAIQRAELVAYYPDADVTEHVRREISDDVAIPTDDKRSITVDVVDGVVTLSGNVRVHQTRGYAGALAAAVPGVVNVRNELKVDFDIEAALGMALSASGVEREAQVYARSNLGEVRLDGYAPTQRAVDDVIRTVARVPGVRKVINHIQVRSGALAR